MADEDSIPKIRTCTKCGCVKSMDLFGNATKGRYGKKSKCKDCEKLYIDQNREVINRYWRDRLREIRRNKKSSKPEFCGPIFSGHLKKCCCCAVAKEFDKYSASSSNKDLLQRRCIECSAEASVKYRGKNKDKINASRKKWRHSNPDKAKKERDSSYRSKVARLGEQLYIRSRIANGIRRSLASGKQGKKTFELLDFTLSELIEHLERQFQKGMSWGNMSMWHIDHIVPISSFGAIEVGSSEFKAAWSLYNLRPIWAEENISKNDKRIFLL